MIRITKEQIKEIADQLDCGMKCYIDKETGIIKSVPDFDSWQTGDTELWEDVLNELDENWGNYLEIERMESHISFDVMVEFAEDVDSRELHDTLINVLNRKHPFGNFKWVIDNSGPYRQKWFDFKTQSLKDWVIAQLEGANIAHDDE
jgi:hypothetical protein